MRLIILNRDKALMQDGSKKRTIDSITIFAVVVAVAVAAVAVAVDFVDVD